MASLDDVRIIAEGMEEELPAGAGGGGGIPGFDDEVEATPGVDGTGAPAAPQSAVPAAEAPIDTPPEVPAPVAGPAAPKVDPLAPAPAPGAAPAAVSAQTVTIDRDLLAEILRMVADGQGSAPEPTGLPPIGTEAPVEPGGEGEPGEMEEEPGEDDLPPMGGEGESEGAGGAEGKSEDEMPSDDELEVSEEDVRECREGTRNVIMEEFPPKKDDKKEDGPPKKDKKEDGPPKDKKEDGPKDKKEDGPPKKDKKEDGPPKKDKKEDGPPKKDKKDGPPKKDKKDGPPKEDKEDDGPPKDGEDEPVDDAPLGEEPPMGGGGGGGCDCDAIATKLASLSATKGSLTMADLPDIKQQMFPAAIKGEIVKCPSCGKTIETGSCEGCAMPGEGAGAGAVPPVPGAAPGGAEPPVPPVEAPAGDVPPAAPVSTPPAPGGETPAQEAAEGPAHEAAESPAEEAAEHPTESVMKPVGEIAECDKKCKGKMPKRKPVKEEATPAPAAEPKLEDEVAALAEEKLKIKPALRAAKMPNAVEFLGDQDTFLELCEALNESLAITEGKEKAKGGLHKYSRCFPIHGGGRYWFAFK